MSTFSVASCVWQTLGSPRPLRHLCSGITQRLNQPRAVEGDTIHGPGAFETPSFFQRARIDNIKAESVQQTAHNLLGHAIVARDRQRAAIRRATARPINPAPIIPIFICKYPCLAGRLNP